MVCRVRFAVAAMVWVSAWLVGTSPAAGFPGAYVSGGEAEVFNDATQVVVMRDGKTTVVSIQANYEGPPEDFAMIVPSPEVLNAENVETVEAEVFEKVDWLTAPRLVEYWERDPCLPAKPKFPGLSGEGLKARSRRMNADVEVEAEFTVGEYDIVALSSDESAALQHWLESNGYNIPDDATPYLESYLRDGSKFFVAKVNADKIQFDASGRAVLSPLRFHYESDQFALPVRLGLINSKGTQDLIVHILARGQRYNVANYPNATIPTNLHVLEDVRQHFPRFYRTLFRKTLETYTETVDGQKRAPVVTEYAWNASSCQPCPGPTLKAEDYLTLGADVIVDSDGEVTRGQVPRDFVITRLHTRYQKNQVGSELIFQKAPAITGGRGGAEPKHKKAEESSGRNAFQGRYLIRHRWEGEVDCADPTYERWSGRSDDGPRTTIAPGPNTRVIGVSNDERTVDLSAELGEDIVALGVTADPGISEDRVPNVGSSQDCKGCSTADSGPVGGWWLAVLMPVVCVVGRRRG